MRVTAGIRYDSEESADIDDQQFFDEQPCQEEKQEDDEGEHDMAANDIASAPLIGGEFNIHSRDACSPRMRWLDEASVRLERLFV